MVNVRLFFKQLSNEIKSILDCLSDLYAFSFLILFSYYYEFCHIFEQRNDESVIIIRVVFTRSRNKILRDELRIRLHNWVKIAKDLFTKLHNVQ